MSRQERRGSAALLRRLLRAQEIAAQRLAAQLGTAAGAARSEPVPGTERWSPGNTAGQSGHCSLAARRCAAAVATGLARELLCPARAGASLLRTWLVSTPHPGRSGFAASLSTPVKCKSRFSFGLKGSPGGRLGNASREHGRTGASVNKARHTSQLRPVPGPCQRTRQRFLSSSALRTKLGFLPQMRLEMVPGCSSR